MVWDKTNPAGATKIKDSDDEIRDNFAAIETVLGTNITAGPTTIQGAILGDATKGRNLRISELYVRNGSNAATLKCELASQWNGDTIGETDNVAKNATTGNFSLDAAGTVLTIEAAGLTGNCIGTIGSPTWNASGTDLILLIRAISNDITVHFRDATASTGLDGTTLVDTGIIYLMILYITDA